MTDYTKDTVISGGRGDTAGKLWRPLRDVAVVDTTIETINNLQKRVLELEDTTDTLTADTSATVSSTTVLQVSGVSATESPFKTNSGQLLSLVAVNFTPNAGDPSFSGVEVWFTNYNGSANAQLMAEGRTSPVQFLCETTQETVTVTVVAYHADGATSDFTLAPTTTVLLDGVTSAPPAPTISQTLVGTPTGFQFAFIQVALPVGTQDVVQSYRIYRNTVNNSATKTYLTTVPHDATATGAIVFFDPAPNGQVYYYWITAVNTSGLESALTAAQSSAQTTLTPIDSSGNVVLKNIVQIQGSPSATTLSGGTFVVVPDMTTTLTTHGNNILCTFFGIFEYASGVSGSSEVQVALFRDGVQASPVFPAGALFRFPVTFSWLDQPPAGSHTYDIRWRVTSGTATFQANGNSRALQIVELG